MLPVKNKQRQSKLNTSILPYGGWNKKYLMIIDKIRRQQKHGLELVIDKCGLTADCFTAFEFSALYRKHTL